MFQSVTTEFYSGCREQFLVSTNWIKDRQKTIHAIASPTKSIFALSTALHLLYFFTAYTAVYIYSYLCLLYIYCENASWILNFIVSLGVGQIDCKWTEFVCLCTECTALADSVQSRLTVPWRS